MLARTNVRPNATIVAARTTHRRLVSNLARFKGAISVPKTGLPFSLGSSSSRVFRPSIMLQNAPKANQGKPSSSRRFRKVSQVNRASLEEQEAAFQKAEQERLAKEQERLKKTMDKTITREAEMVYLRVRAAEEAKSESVGLNREAQLKHLQKLQEIEDKKNQKLIPRIKRFLKDDPNKKKEPGTFMGVDLRYIALAFAFSVISFGVYQKSLYVEWIDSLRADWKEKKDLKLGRKSSNDFEEFEKSFSIEDKEDQDDERNDDRDDDAPWSFGDEEDDNNNNNNHNNNPINTAPDSQPSPEEDLLTASTNDHDNLASDGGDDAHPGHIDPAPEDKSAQTQVSDSSDTEGSPITPWTATIPLIDTGDKDNSSTPTSGDDQLTSPSKDTSVSDSSSTESNEQETPVSPSTESSTVVPSPSSPLSDEEPTIQPPSYNFSYYVKRGLISAAKFTTGAALYLLYHHYILPQSTMVQVAVLGTSAIIAGVAAYYTYRSSFCCKKKVSSDLKNHISIVTGQNIAHHSHKPLQLSKTIGVSTAKDAI